MSAGYKATLVALANAAREPGRWVHVRDVAKGLPGTPGNHVVAMLGTLEDYGDVTTSGFGTDRTARIDGVLLSYPDGRVGVLLYEGHVIQEIDPILWAANRYEIILSSTPTGDTTT
jgi:hypothetical protein